MERAEGRKRESQKVVKVVKMKCSIINDKEASGGFCLKPVGHRKLM